MKEVSRKEAKSLGAKHYFTGVPCKRGHVAQRLVSSLGCLVCGNLLRRKNDRPDDVRAIASNTAEQGRDYARDAGLKHYNGTACSKCGGVSRYVQSGACVECGRLHAMAQRTTDPIGTVLYARDWRARNPDYEPPGAADKDRCSAIGRARYHRTGGAERRARREEKIAWEIANQAIIIIEKEAKRVLTRAKKAEMSRSWRKENPELCAAIDRNKRAVRRGAPGSHTADDILRIGALQKWKCAWCSKSCKKGYHVDHIHPVSRGGSNDASNLVISCASCNSRKHATDPLTWARKLGKLL